MITVYVKKIESISEHEQQSIINSLSASALKRLNNKKNEQLHLASLCALSLLSDEQRKNLDYNENGKPSFSTLDSEISISHSATLAAIAISNSKLSCVGIDVEDICASRVSSRFLTENEKPFATDESSFISIWTKKEALFKFLKNDSIPFIQLDSTQPQKHNARFVTVQIENSILTVCAHENEKIEIIQK